MKLNWGTGIAIFYTFFITAMVSMVIKSCHHKSHLVEEEYYQKDLDYEEFRLKRINGNLFKDEVKIKLLNDNNELSISFPRELTNIDGTLNLYRPSNKYFDKEFNIKLDSTNKMKLPLGDDFAKGLWRVKVDWSNNSKEYFNELTFAK